MDGCTFEIKAKWVDKILTVSGVIEADRIVITRGEAFWFTGRYDFVPVDFDKLAGENEVARPESEKKWAEAAAKRVDELRSIDFIRLGPDGLAYARIPPGTFTMGCSPEDPECESDEKPAHKVTITRGFWMGQTEVTVGAYKRFAKTAGRDMPREPDWFGDLLNPGWKSYLN